MESGLVWIFLLYIDQLQLDMPAVCITYTLTRLPRVWSSLCTVKVPAFSTRGSLSNRILQTDLVSCLFVCQLIGEIWVPYWKTRMRDGLFEIVRYDETLISVGCVHSRWLCRDRSIRLPEVRNIDITSLVTNPISDGIAFELDICYQIWMIYHTWCYRASNPQHNSLAYTTSYWRPSTHPSLRLPPNLEATVEYS